MFVKKRKKKENRCRVKPTILWENRTLLHVVLEERLSISNQEFSKSSTGKHYFNSDQNFKYQEHL